MSVHTEKYEAICQTQAYQDLRADILQTLSVRAFENNWGNWFRNLRYYVLTLFLSIPILFILFPSAETIFEDSTHWFVELGGLLGLAFLSWPWRINKMHESVCRRSAARNPLGQIPALHETQLTLHLYLEEGTVQATYQEETGSEKKVWSCNTKQLWCLWKGNDALLLVDADSVWGTNLPWGNLTLRYWWTFVSMLYPNAFLFPLNSVSEQQRTEMYAWLSQNGRTFMTFANSFDERTVPQSIPFQVPLDTYLKEVETFCLSQVKRGCHPSRSTMAIAVIALLSTLIYEFPMTLGLILAKTVRYPFSAYVFCIFAFALLLLFLLRYPMVRVFLLRLKISVCLRQLRTKLIHTGGSDVVLTGTVCRNASGIAVRFDLPFAFLNCETDIYTEVSDGSGQIAMLRKNGLLNPFSFQPAATCVIRSDWFVL